VVWLSKKFFDRGDYRRGLLVVEPVRFMLPPVSFSLSARESGILTTTIDEFFASFSASLSSTNEKYKKTYIC
jgi:hypothetical protein